MIESKNEAQGDEISFDWFETLENILGSYLTGLLEKLGLGILWVAGWIFCVPLMLSGLAVTAMPLAVTGPPEGFNPWPGAVIWWIASVVAAWQAIVSYHLIKAKTAEDLRLKKGAGERAASLLFIKEACQQLQGRSSWLRFCCFTWWSAGWLFSIIIVSLYLYAFDSKSLELSYWQEKILSLVLSVQVTCGGNTLLVMAFACVYPSMVSLRKLWFLTCLADGGIIWLIGKPFAEVLVQTFQR